jgi:hypothetical protein
MTENQDGFTEGEEILFRAYQHISGDMVGLNAAFDQDYPSSDGTFADHGISVIDHLKFSTSGIDEPASLVNFYPNPAKSFVTFTNSSGKSCQLNISNLRGETLIRTEISHEIQVDVSGLARGVYVVTLSVDDFTTARKLVLR